jgi:propionyl-CoA carboxylase beta chain
VSALRAVREIFDYLPLSNKDVPAPRPTLDSRYRQEDSLRYLVPDDPNVPYDMLEVVKKV